MYLKRACILIFLNMIGILSFPRVLCAEENYIEVKVRPGDTLHNFAEKYLKDPADWPKIYELNKAKLRDPDRIYPDQIIQVPRKMLSEKVGDISALKKDVKVKKKNGVKWEKAVKGGRLFPDDGVKTGKSSFVNISFLAGGALEVRPDTLLYLKSFSKKNPVASLFQGTLRSKSAKIVTPGAEVEPSLGSIYDVDIDKKKTTKVSVRTGKVSVSAQGKKVVVPQGFGTVVEYKKTPSAPKLLPVSGNEILELLRDDMFYADLKLSIMLASDKNFNNIIKDFETKELGDDIIKKGLKPGKYYWKVAVISADGLIGEYSDPQLIIVSVSSEEFVKVTGFELVDKETNLVKVSGIAKDADRVIVNGYPCARGDAGEFEANIILDPELTTITVTAFGKTGVVLRKYHKSETDGSWYPAK